MAASVTLQESRPDADLLTLEEARLLPLSYWIGQVCTHPGVHDHASEA